MTIEEIAREAAQKLSAIYFGIAECDIPDLTEAILAAITKSREQSVLGLPETSADRVEAVLQKIRELSTRWTKRYDAISINPVTTADYRDGLRDATGDCQTDLEELLSWTGGNSLAVGVSSKDSASPAVEDMGEVEKAKSLPTATRDNS